MKHSETAWLIERRGVGEPEWLFTRDKGAGVSAFGWSKDSTEALKFETQAEADSWRRAWLISGETTVTEHEWVPPPEKPAAQP